MTDLSPGPSEPPEILEGLLDLRVTNAGSKSEMISAVLVPDDGEAMVLHERGFEGLSASPDLAAYAGTRVRVVGRRGWSSFVVDRVEPLGPASGCGR